MSATLSKSILGPIFDAVSLRAAKILAADHMILLVIDPSSKSICLMADKGIAEQTTAAMAERLRKDLFQMPRSPEEQLATSATPDACNQQQLVLLSAVESTLNITNTLTIPFTLEESGNGFLVWCRKQNAELFDEASREKAGLLAEQLALSLRLSLNESTSRELNAKLAALLELSTLIYSSLNYTEVLEKAIHMSMDIVGADGGSIFILDKKQNLLVPLITVDARHAEQISKMTLKLGQGLTGLVAKTGVGLISNRSDTDPRAFKVPGTPDEPESIICAPLTWSGEVIGVMTLRSTKCKQFKQEDLDILTIFARQTADAIENAKLYESLEKAYQELASTQEQLVMTEKLRALGEMAGGVAHDFNNVLGAILGRTQLLLREVQDERLLKHLRQIEKVTLAGARTVQRMQNFTRVSCVGSYETIDLDRVIEEAIEMTKPRWRDQCQREGVAIDLVFDCQPNLTILGNHAELVEAFSNLILNAVDALPQGGAIKIVAAEDSGKAVVKVQDNGVGMDESTLKRIFFPFFTTKGKQGTGMGLSVVYGIVGRHKGEIDVWSKPGEGTVFTLSFPLCQCAQKTVVPAAVSKHEVTVRVLLVDDDENVRSVMSDMLEHLGHTVVAAASGEEALKLFQKENFDLVVTDLGMPGISGWDVTRVCKSLKPKVPVIMVSGWGNQIDNRMVVESQVDAVLAKPFEIAKIKSVMETVLAGVSQVGSG